MDVIDGSHIVYIISIRRIRSFNEMYVYKVTSTHDIKSTHVTIEQHASSAVLRPI